MYRPIKYICWIFASGCLLFTGWLLLRIFICDQFVIPSDSMAPTLIAGDRILVNKLIAGARIYTKLEFGQDIPLRSFRIPGFRPVRVNDVVAFNVPHGYKRDRIEFCINYVYAKRCVGTPGDSVSIRDGYLRNNRYTGDIGCAGQQRMFSALPDSLIPPTVLRAMPFDDGLFGWTIKNFGPLYVPRAGARIPLDFRNYELYRQLVEYETGGNLTFGEKALLDGHPLEEYTFRRNYYFLCGDNVANSEDSRYWGFVPEEFIIGVISRITYSEEPVSGQRRPDRRWKPVE